MISKAGKLRRKYFCLLQQPLSSPALHWINSASNLSPSHPLFPMVKHEICSECCRQVFNINNCEILTFNLMCRTSLADKKIIANSYHQAFVLLLSVGRFLIGNPLEMTISIIVLRYCFSHLPACKHLFAGKELIRNIH